MPDAADKVAVKVAFAAFSFDVVTSLIESDGAASSSVMIRLLVSAVSTIVIFTGFESVTVTVSLASSVESASTPTVTVFSVSPGAKIRVPLAAA